MPSRGNFMVRSSSVIGMGKWPMRSYSQSRYAIVTCESCGLGSAFFRDPAAAESNHS